jgi:WS/DGAT/MGAT family acyltransferase
MALTLRRRNRQPNVSPPPGLFSAPKTFLNVAVTPHRRFAMAEVPLSDIKLIKNALGGTVNDVVLAVCAGALRNWLADHGERPEQDLVGFVPISVRTEDQKGAMGNRVSGMLVGLATSVKDPVERLRTIHDATKDAKDQEKAISAEVLTDWTEFAAPALAARAARLASSLRVLDRLNNAVFNLVISNVPGPDFPLYSAGARVLGVWPMGPISDGAALNITVMSYLGTVNFGLVASREVAPDLEALAHYIGEATEELLKAAGPSTTNGSSPRPKPAAAKPKTAAGKRVAAAKAGSPAPRRRRVATG